MDNCSGNPQLGYSEFSERLHQRARAQRIPITGSLEVTHRCNLRCLHCYLPIENRAGSNQTELSLPEITHILDEVTDAGCLWLLLTGGEPLLRKDILDIYKYAKHKGLIVTLFTNGTLLTPRIADYLADWRPFNLEITLYGATQATYEKVTGIEGSYARCRRGIELCLERGLSLSLKTITMTLNVHELDKMRAMARDFGLRFRLDPMVSPALDGSARPTSYRLSPEEIITIDKTDPERSLVWQNEFKKKDGLPSGDWHMYQCGAGMEGFHIDANGHMSICMTSRKPFYDLREGSFNDCWQQFFPGVLSSKYSADFVCLTCQLRYVCAQCPALSDLEYGEIEKPVEFVCELTKHRQSVFASASDV